MPSWGSGLASALTQGATGYVEQQDVNRRELLAAAARKRAEQIAQREAEEGRVERLARLGASGAVITPVTPDATVPEVDPVPPIPATTREAGAAANPPKGRNVGRIGGYDVSIPEGGKPDPTAARQAEAGKQRLRNLEAAVARLPEGHPLKRPAEELPMIADSDAAYRQFVEDLRQPSLDDRVREKRALNPEQFDGRAGSSGDGVDRDARSRRRQYDARVNNLKAALRRDFPAAMGPEKRRVQDNYYNARRDLANEFSDVAPQTDLNPNTRSGAPKPTAGQVSTPGNKGEAPDDVVIAALQRFGGDQAKALAHLRTQGYK